jgi:hypothetical protein
MNEDIHNAVIALDLGQSIAVTVDNESFSGLDSGLIELSGMVTECRSFLREESVDVYTVSVRSESLPDQFDRFEIDQRDGEYVVSIRGPFDGEGHSQLIRPLGPVKSIETVLEE